MIKKMIVLCVALIPVMVNASSKIVAIVGQNIITNADIQHRFVLMQELNQNQIKLNNVIRKGIIESLIKEALYLKEAKSHDIIVRKEDIEKEISQIKQSNNSINIKNKSLWQLLRAKISWSILINEQIRPKISVSNDEIADFIKTIKPLTKIQLKQIIIPNQLFIKNKDIMVKQKKKINSCKNANKFTKNFNLDEPELIDIDSSALNKDIADMINNLTIGQPSKFINIGSDTQFYIVCNRKNKKDNLPNYNQIKQKLLIQKIELAANNYLAKIKKKTFIEYR